MWDTGEPRACSIVVVFMYLDHSFTVIVVLIPGLSLVLETFVIVGVDVCVAVPDVRWHRFFLDSLVF